MKHMILSVVFGLAVSVAAQADVTGTYTGAFDGRAGTLTVSYSNSNGYSVAFAGADGVNDLIGAGCESVIGAVEKVTEKKGEVRKIRFAFSPGNCLGIWGQELTVEFKNGKASLEIYSHTEDNGQMCLPDANGRSNCTRMERHVFLTGKFSKN